MYRFGNGSGSGGAKPDFAAAMYWYKRASDHGVARASYHLATMYHEGIGGPVNDEAAQALFTKAADAGYVPAMVPLAFLYAAKPDVVSKRRAAEWGLKAAEADDPEGHLLAGYLWDKDLSRFFNRGGQPITALQQAAVAMLELVALSAAYRIAHPEVAAQEPAQDAGNTGYVDTSYGDNGYGQLQNDIHYAQMQNQVWGGGCRPPVGCY